MAGSGLERRRDEVAQLLVAGAAVELDAEVGGLGLEGFARRRGFDRRGRRLLVRGARVGRRLEPAAASALSCAGSSAATSVS
jgi:hypothetical protein